MNNIDIEYIKFDSVNPKYFLPLLNKLKNREHLIQHDLFDINTTNSWMQSKIIVDSNSGCKVRAIYLKHELIGWCGIQLENEKYEIAIVIDEKAWGVGVNIFRHMIGWAKDLGHEEVYIHFLHTRPKYKFLQKMATQVYESELFGSKFTTYQLTVK